MAEILHIYGPKINEAFTFYVALAGTADPDTFQVNPTLAAGDAVASTAGGAFGNLATLPDVDPAGGRAVRIQLSAGEMNGAQVVVLLEDTTVGEEWVPIAITITTRTVDVDDLVRSTTPANTYDVSATGEGGLDFDNVKAATGATTLTNITVPIVTTLTGHTVQTGDSFARLGAPAATVSADIAAVKVDTAATLVDTAELQGDWTNGGRLDLIVDAILADTLSLDGTKIPDTLSLVNINAEVDTALNTAIPGGPAANSINQRIVAVDDLTQAAGGGDLAAIIADTNELQTDWANAGRLDALIDAIIVTIGGSTTGANINMAQTYTEGQSARTVGGSLEVSEAIERNRLNFVGGQRILFRSNNTTALVTRNQSDTELTVP